MPPKPIPQEKVNDYYNVDFSLSHQLRLVGATPPPQEGPPSKYNFVVVIKQNHSNQDKWRVWAILNNLLKELNRSDPGKWNS